MALIEILPDSNPVMRKTCRKVKHVDTELRKLVEDMYETMVENYGIGLAAPQVGMLKRFFIYEIPKRELKGYETCLPDGAVARQVEGESEVEQAVSAQPIRDEVPDETVNQPDEEAQDEDEDEDEDAEDWGYTGVYTVCINPRIISREGVLIEEEGCLSKGGWVAKVERAFRVTFQAYGLDMNRFEKTVEGLEARCILHETDHLDGILFTDRAIPGTLREVGAEEDGEGAVEMDGTRNEEGEGGEETSVSELKDSGETTESMEESAVASDA